MKSTINNNFFDRVYKIVARIPYGKVTTYGDIAEACGARGAARTVGWAIKGASVTGLPCHRVVNRYGALTGRLHFGDPDLMEDMLRSEGIEFDDDGCVKMEKYLWKPKPLRSQKKRRKKARKKINNLS